MAGETVLGENHSGHPRIDPLRGATVLGRRKALDCGYPEPAIQNQPEAAQSGLHGRSDEWRGHRCGDAEYHDRSVAAALCLQAFLADGAALAGRGDGRSFEADFVVVEVVRPVYRDAPGTDRRAVGIEGLRTPEPLRRLEQRDCAGPGLRDPDVAIHVESEPLGLGSRARATEAIGSCGTKRSGRIGVDDRDGITSEVRDPDTALLVARQTPGPREAILASAVAPPRADVRGVASDQLRDRVSADVADRRIQETGAVGAGRIELDSPAGGGFTGDVDLTTDPGC